MRIQMLKYHVIENPDDRSRQTYLAGNFYEVTEAEARAWIAAGIAADPDAPLEEPPKPATKRGGR